MNWIALRMLTGDRSKYLGLIFGVSFATLLMSQQVSIFMGILTRTGNQILDIRDADIWVMDNRVRFVDEAPALQDTDLLRVRGVPGVGWAVRREICHETVAGMRGGRLAPWSRCANGRNQERQGETPRHLEGSDRATARRIGPERGRAPPDLLRR